MGIRAGAQRIKPHPPTAQSMAQSRKAVTLLDQLTPVELRDGIWFKRDDLFSIAGASGGKARACYALARAAERGLITASARHSPQATIVARIARHLGLCCRIHTPTGGITPELEEAVAHGATRIPHR